MFHHLSNVLRVCSRNSPWIQRGVIAGIRSATPQARPLVFGANRFFSTKHDATTHSCSATCEHEHEHGHEHEQQSSEQAKQEVYVEGFKRNPSTGGLGHDIGGTGGIGVKNPDMVIVYTCNVCEKRDYKGITKKAYTEGVVIIQCAGCRNLHLVADNLGWFNTHKTNITDYLREAGREHDFSQTSLSIDSFDALQEIIKVTSKDAPAATDSTPPAAEAVTSTNTSRSD